MRFRILITIIASVCLAVSGLANAVVITHNNYTLNPSTNIVTHTDGTEWLQWDVTKGKSIDEALGIYESDGWVLAGNTQMGSLFADFGWIGGIDENSTYYYDSPYTSIDGDSAMDQFLELFGNTRTVSGGVYGVGADEVREVIALFGDDADGDSKFNAAAVQSDFTTFSTITDKYIALRTSDILTSSNINSIYGVALVRVTEVPEPSTLAIFALGMIGLASRRFKKQS
jgi:hypothetical protein